MITVTTTAPTTTLTPLASPVVDSAQAAAMQGTIASDDFSSALNDQLNLATTPAVSTDAASVTLLTTTELMTTVANAATPVETPSVEPNTLVNASAMSEQDTAILSTVTDTLKFITSGAKLGDTLPEGQSVQLPSVNLSTTLTQQTVQSVVNQAVTQTQVTTPADILAKQIMPLQTSTATGNTQAMESPDVSVSVLEAINNNLPQNSNLNKVDSTQKTLQTTSSLQDAAAPAMTLANQTAVPQNSDLQNKIVQQTAAQAQASVQTGADIETVSQTKTVTANLTQEATMPQGGATNQQPTPQLVVKQEAAPVVFTQNSTQQSTVNQPQSAPLVQTASTDSTLVTQQSLQDDASRMVAQTAPKMLKLKESIDSATVADSAALVNENLAVSAQTTIAVTSQSGDAGQLPESPASTNDSSASQQTVVDTTLAPDTLVAVQLTPQVVAQDAPVEQTESNLAFDKGSDNSNASTDKITTLTSAKTLLMDAVANRNNSGDAGNNNNGSNNTPQNSSLNNDASLNQSIDNKQNIDTKSFAALLNAEKSDVISVSNQDKATPQVMNAVVNKLAQEMKTADVAPLSRPLSHPQWNEDLGERIVWMNSRGISSAEIKMNPEHMGPISVRIDMNQDQATIAFTAQNSAVRDALEASFPKLRDMLSAQQVNLADVSVSQQSTSNSDSGRSAFAQATADMSNGQGNRQNAPEVDSEGNVIASNANNESVDEFANAQTISTNGTNGLLSLYA